MSIKLMVFNVIKLSIKPPLKLALVYRGRKDPFRFTVQRITEAKAMHRVCRVLEGVHGVPLQPGEFTIKKRPREVGVSSRLAQTEYFPV